ncbi:A/G-specific adenine glycosylase [Bifidobacterium sp. ESL0728]|uniref:A/G-specific adenine glycosylase n=1 Tax=Bifidobacterium sp. ESL0728 TaxID=2983220 RepID=UPI0023F88DBA|nr:A/G-specific adenine glycosylase [Bifidobacterium sp. ESL0728]WEV59911.1 A/G-specific adenine glycosylase [Bifidobacterium sp. ESL0728]
MKQELFSWWDENARDLPWRFGRTTPWGILISEVMSQQTQMSRVVQYWTNWMEVWPDAESLARASTAEVITAWGRLGYPRRALRLQECAKVVAEQYRNELPKTYDELIALPGIGDYTASAVMSFAFGERIAVLDTNVRRVLWRTFKGEESFGGATKSEERKLANAVLPQDPKESVIWNEALIELGALVCTAKNPRIDEDPWASHSRFYAAGCPHMGEKRTRPRQSFKGTNRQVRGIVLNALRALANSDAADVAGNPGNTGNFRNSDNVSNAGAADNTRNAGAADNGSNNVTAGNTGNAAKTRKTASLSRPEVENLWPDQIQLDACIASLDEDGLIEIGSDGSLSLPI